MENNLDYYYCCGCGEHRGHKKGSMQCVSCDTKDEWNKKVNEEKTQKETLPKEIPNELLNLLGTKLTGMRMSADGLILNAIRSLPKECTGEIWSLDQLREHLNELGNRFYNGDVKVVDEFLQLYCLAKNRPTTEKELI